ncbi:hypothetical protein E3G68_005099 [Mycobacteroides abscessus]|uniref:hypothetical protein n=1 Tax=Mycobacteroides abscessus TaxID=36809 RepID=UPI00187790D8|nr:hypothetical protein [Mycobacteroides abscessus]
MATRASLTPTRTQLHHWISQDAHLARIWAQRHPRARDTANDFAEWCTATAGQLASPSIIDPDAIAAEWRLRAHGSGIRAASWPITAGAFAAAALLAGLIAATTGHPTAGLALLLPALLTIGITIAARPTPHLLVGPADRTRTNRTKPAKRLYPATLFATRTVATAISMWHQLPKKRRATP